VREAIQARDPTLLREAGPAPRAALTRVHPGRYLDLLEGIATSGGGALDHDTIMSRESFEAAVCGAGAAVEAVRHALDSGSNTFVAIRPPGHHALHQTAMGFCLLANAVIAAREAQAMGCGRVLIVDWDVHHGNGTQALVERDPSLRFVSLHQWPLYPGTGAASERGVGNVFNVPRPPGLPPEQYVRDLWAAIGTAVTGWAPDLIVISAGYDSMLGDPLGGFTLEPEHYAKWVGLLRSTCPEAPIVALMEGGYDPDRLAAGVLATVEALI